MDFANGGAFAVSRGSYYSGGYVFDFPMPSARRLKSGETLIVQPPSIKASVKRARWEPGGVIGIQKAPYDDNAIPSAFFLNDAKFPTRVSAYVMRAAYSQDTRVKLLSVDNEIVDHDVRQGIAKEVPWFALSEIIMQARLDRGVEGLSGDLSDVYRSHPGKLVKLKAAIDPVPMPELSAVILKIAPRLIDGKMIDLSDVAPTFRGAFASAGEALARNQEVHVPMALSANTGRISWPTDPRIVEYVALTGPQQNSEPNKTNTQRKAMAGHLQSAVESFVPGRFGSFELPPLRSGVPWTSADERLSLHWWHSQLSIQANDAGGPLSSANSRHTLAI